MDLVDLVARTQRDLDNKTAALERTKASARELQAEVNALTEELRVLRAVGERHKAFGPTPQPPAADTPPVAPETSGSPTSESPVENGWTALYRTDAVLLALREADRSLGPTEITNVLHRHGRTNDDAHLVSAALQHLLRGRKIEKAERGKWRIAQPQQQGTGVVPFPAPQAPLPGGSPAAASN